MARTMAHFFPDWAEWLDDLHDPRDQMRIVYPLRFLVTTGVLAFLTKLGARRQIKYSLNTKPVLVGTNRLAHASMEQIAHPDTLEYLMKRLSPAELAAFLTRLVRRLIRMKCLDRFRLDGYLLIAVDGTGHVSFRKRHCDRCLTQKQGDTTIYYHLVLEAKIVTENGMAISVVQEFVENDDPEADKQDCELKAFYRLAARLKLMFPQMRFCLLLDGLYFCEPVMKVCRDNRWGYITTFKEGSAPSAWRESRSLMELSPENRLLLEKDDVRQEFRWVEGVEMGTEKTNVLECAETSAGGEVTAFVWGTNMPLNARTVCGVANRGGRLRWKIENEGFNEQKNGGYNLEHAYSENTEAAKNYYTLLQIAQIIELLIRKGSLVARAIGGSVRKVIGGVRKLARYLRESLRVWVVPPEAFDLEAARRIQIRLDGS